MHRFDVSSIAVAIRVFSVDDHPLFSEGLRSLVGASEGMVLVGHATRCAQARVELETAEVDVVTVDLTLPDGHGLDLVRAVREFRPPIRFLVLSMHRSDDYAIRALRAGARGYVEKTASPDTIVGAIRSVAAGEIAVDREVLAQIASGMSNRPRHAISELGSLTDREVEVFELVGRGLATREIAAHLGVSAKTIDAHKANIMRKLGVRGAVRLHKAAFAWLAEGSPRGESSELTNPRTVDLTPLREGDDDPPRSEHARGVPRRS